MRNPVVLYLRVRADGKRVWEYVGTDPDRVASALRRKALELQGAEQGMIFAAEAPVPAPLKAVPKTTGRPLKDAVSEYLLETKAQESRKTLAAYRTTLNMFMESCKKEDLEDLDRKDLLASITFLRDGGNGPRTVRNRVDYFQIFLHHFGLPSLLKGKDLPKYTEKKVRACSDNDLEKMLSQANQEESDLLHFLLCTGTREQEAQVRLLDGP